MADEKSKKRIWDKLLMGAIIGGAIGSVVGATIAPKKGKETRKEIVEAAKTTGKKSRQFFQKLKGIFSFGKNKQTNPSNETGQNQKAHDPLKKIPHENIAEIEQ